MCPAKTQIQYLPAELLDMVFTYLDLDCLKAASLVCRHWFEVTASHRCWSNPRFYVKVNSQNIPSLLESDRKRKYRNAFLEINPEDAVNVANSLSFLMQHSSTLKSTHLKFDRKLVKAEDLTKLLGCIPELQELQLESCLVRAPTDMQLKRLKRFTFINNTLESNIFPIPTFAPNLEYLSLEISTVSESWWTILCQTQLKVLRIKFVHVQHLRQLWRLTLPFLEKLCLEPCNKIPIRTQEDSTSEEICQFFQRHPLLTDVQFNIEYPLAIYTKIVDCCPKMISLHVTKLAEPHSFFDEISTSDIKSLTISDTIINFEERPDLRVDTVQIVTLRSVKILPKKTAMLDLARKFPKLRVLELNSCNPDLFSTWKSAIESADTASSFENLEILIINAVKIILPSIENLAHLPKLRELKLSCLAVTDWPRNVQQASLRVLKLNVTKLTYYQLKRLIEVFPNLARMDLYNSHSFPAKAFARVRKQMPRLVINKAM